MASKRLRDAVGIDPDRVVSAALEAALGELEQPHKKRHPGRVLAAGAALAAAAAVGQRRLPRMAKLPLRMGLHKLEDLAHVDELADALHDRADALRDRLAAYGDDVRDDDADDEEEFDDEPDDEPDDDLPEDAEDEDLDDEDEDDLDDEDGDDFDDGPEDDDGPRDEGDGEEPEPEDEEEEELEDEPEDEPEDEELGDVDDDLPPEEDEEDDEKVAARGIDLGVSSRRDAGSARDRVPDLFEALRSPPRRAPVMRRGSRRVDPASRPPEPSAGRHPDERRGSSRKSKPTTARA